MTGDTHRNHVGIGITVYTRNKFRRVGKKYDLSMRELLEIVAKTVDFDAMPILKQRLPVIE